MWTSGCGQNEQRLLDERLNFTYMASKGVWVLSLWNTGIPFRAYALRKKKKVKKKEKNMTKWQCSYLYSYAVTGKYKANVVNRIYGNETTLSLWDCQAEQLFHVLQALSSRNMHSSLLPICTCNICERELCISDCSRQNTNFWEKKPTPSVLQPPFRWL